MQNAHLLHVLDLAPREFAVQQFVRLTFWLDGSLLISLDLVSSDQLGVQRRPPLPS